MTENRARKTVPKFNGSVAEKSSAQNTSEDSTRWPRTVARKTPQKVQQYGDREQQRTKQLSRFNSTVAESSNTNKTVQSVEQSLNTSTQANTQMTRIAYVKYARSLFFKTREIRRKHFPSTTRKREFLNGPYSHLFENVTRARVIQSKKEQKSDVNTLLGQG